MRLVMCVIEPLTTEEVLDWMLRSAGEVLAAVTPDFRCGLAVGMVDDDGVVHLLCDRVKPDSPDRWGDEVQYDLYAGLKAGTALRTGEDTVDLEEDSIVRAVHAGGLLFELTDSLGTVLVFALAVSGFESQEDREYAEMCICALQHQWDEPREDDAEDEGE